MSDEQTIITKHENGKLELTSAPPIIEATKESIEDLFAKHNRLIDNVNHWRTACDKLLAKIALTDGMGGEDTCRAAEIYREAERLTAEPTVTLRGKSPFDEPMEYHQSIARGQKLTERKFEEYPPEVLGYLQALPLDLQDRIGWGYYGGTEQYYIKGVDGTLAQLGSAPYHDRCELRRIVEQADAAHKRLVEGRFK